MTIKRDQLFGNLIRAICRKLIFQKKEAQYGFIFSKNYLLCHYITHLKKQTLKGTHNFFWYRSLADRIISNASWQIFGIFFFINLIQGYFTPLLNDEAYYWVYAQQMDWGYFDHPPMIALLIKIGYSVFNNELGVRLLGIIFASLSFTFIYKIIVSESAEKVNLKFLLLMIGSSVFMNLYSFMAIPDTPLLFFTILFFWQFQRFLKDESIFNSILLGIISALLVYSKYHGVLVITLAIFANPKLFTRKSIYIVSFTAILLFIPHLIWQFQHQYPTIRFHLIDKGNSFKINHVFSYLGEQLAFTGPLLLLLFTIIYKARNNFQYTLKFVSLGIFLFFLISSFRGMVNAYWTLVAWPGIVILAYFKMIEIPKYRKWIYTLFVLGVALVIIMRVNFIFNLLPIRNFNNRNPREMVKQLKNNSQHPLVFRNMFIDPSFYLFYQSDSCYAINDITFKKTQFNYLRYFEKHVQNKTVTMVTNSALNEKSRQIKIPKGKKYYLTDLDNFQSYQTSWFVKIDSFPCFNANAEMTLPIQIQYISTERQKATPDSLPKFITLKMQDRKSKMIYTFHKKFRGPGIDSFKFFVPNQKGKFKSYFSIGNDTTALISTYNSPIYNIEIE